MNSKTIGNIIMAFMAVLGAVGTGMLVLPTDIVPAELATKIKEIAGIITGIYVIINPFLPADVFGPLKPTKPE